MFRAIRRQQWSVFNIPLMWAAAMGDRSCPVLQWLAQSAQHLSIPVCGVEMLGHDAVMAGWKALHHALNVKGIQSVEGLSEWVPDQGSTSFSTTSNNTKQCKSGCMWPLPGRRFVMYHLDQASGWIGFFLTEEHKAQT